MRRHEIDEPSNLTIVEAVETLSSIADLDPEKDIGISERHEVMLQGRPVTYRTVHWLQETDADTTLSVIKETFRVVLRYLRSFYREEHGYVTDVQTVEGIKTIMVLVGEAAKKLDRFTKLFHGSKAASVFNLKEYKQLQEFYQKRIARKVDEGTLGKWVLALTAPRAPDGVTLEGRTVAPVDTTKRVIIDLDTVKKDTEYELFFMRKDDGTRYFSPSLLRNIRLVCDFGDYFGEPKGDDPLARIDVWQDWICQITARGIVKAVRREADNFYRYYAQNKEHELVCLVNYMLMGLLLAANPRNLRRNRPVRSCHQYYSDFHTFLREAMASREYQRLVAYPPDSGDKLSWCLLNIVHEVCEGLLVGGVGYTEMTPVITNLVERARRVMRSEEEEESTSTESVWDTLSNDYNAVVKLLRRHPNGPLYKVLGMLKEDGHQFFDPLMQDNVPNRWYDLHVGDTVISNVRMPAPVRQDVINKAVVNDEFKGMLRCYTGTPDHGCHLLFSLEDRTAWLEHSRCEVLERLQDKTDFTHHLCVATLATNTDFYHQMAPYQEANLAEPFIEQLQDHISGDGGGYYIPERMRGTIFTGFLSQLLRAVHTVFFNNRNVLLRRERLDFIQIVHHLLALKIIELVNPESVSFTCKDGVDTGSAFSAGLFGCLKLFNAEEIGQRDMDYLYLMLFGPPILIRERGMLPERFQRTVSMLKAVANARESNGYDGFRHLLQQHLASLYRTPILQAGIALPEPIQILY